MEPVSLTVFQDLVYWTDNHFSDLLLEDKHDFSRKARIDIGLTPLNAVIALDRSMQPDGSLTL